jgi:hypothetical protein
MSNAPGISGWILAPEKLRINPGKSAFYNLAELTINGDWEVTFHLKRPQPAFPMLIAGGSSGIYPCHVPPSQMRQQPPPEGLWGMPPDEVQILPGYSPDVENNRAAGRQIMRLSDTWLPKSGA